MRAPPLTLADGSERLLKLSVNGDRGAMNLPISKASPQGKIDPVALLKVMVTDTLPLQLVSGALIAFM